MSNVCLWIPDPSIVEARSAELQLALLECAPRLVMERRGVIWVDGRGAERLTADDGVAAVAAGAGAGVAGKPQRLAERLVRRLRAMGIEGVRAGVSAVPIVAELAARGPGERRGLRFQVLVRDSTPGSSAPPAPAQAVPKSYSARRRGPAVEGAGRESFQLEMAAGPGAEPACGESSAGPAGPAGSVCSPASGERGGAGAAEAGGAAADLDGASLEGVVRRVGVGEERGFLEPYPLVLLGADPKLLELLEGVGVATCGELAALEREAVEVRFGPEAVRLWKLARADDERRLFGPMPTERPAASLDFVDYTVEDPERLVFTANALLGNVCDALRSRGEHARRMTITLTLANGQQWKRTLRPARPTASRERWLRLTRALLERLSVPEAVAGLGLEVDAAETAGAVQGDLFDRGFATANAVEAALGRLLEDMGPVLAEPDIGGHPLPERRTRWRAAEPVLDATPAGASQQVEPELTLQLLPEPRTVEVETVPRRDHTPPVRYHDGKQWRQLLVSAGPDRISGDRWGEPYAREYFRCVTADGVLVWIFRDAKTDGWYLHGWWD